MLILLIQFFGLLSAGAVELWAQGMVMPTQTSAMQAKKQIRSYCKDKLDNYKIPTKITLVARNNYSERFKKMRVNHAS